MSWEQILELELNDSIATLHATLWSIARARTLIARFPIELIEQQSTYNHHCIGIRVDDSRSEVSQYRQAMP